MLKTIIIAAAALLLAGCGSSGGGGGGSSHTHPPEIVVENPMPQETVNILWPTGWDRLESGVPFGVHKYAGRVFGIDDPATTTIDESGDRAAFEMTANFVAGTGDFKAVIPDHQYPSGPAGPMHIEHEIDRIDVHSGEFYGTEEAHGFGRYDISNPSRHFELTFVVIAGKFTGETVSGNLYEAGGSSSRFNWDFRTGHYTHKHPYYGFNGACADCPGLLNFGAGGAHQAPYVAYFP